MKNKALLFLLCLISCSTLKRSVIGGALLGGVLGGTGGAIFSPNKESTNQNAYIFGVLGAAAGAGLAYFMADDAQNKLKAPMLLDQEREKHADIPLFDFSPDLKGIRPEVNFKPVKKYEVPLEKLPPELEGKVKKQFIIEYESEARTLEIDNRTIEISPLKAWEHVYEK
ncbi:MAG: hypothetical protein HYV97_03585 [Bdellovibrio sp.]|nr:hypothetical protein [Bdellovibrio sp.]